MDLIANTISFLIGFAASVYGNIVASDLYATADARCKRIIARAAKRLAPFEREEVEREWLGDLHERDTVQAKYAHAVGCWFAAPKMRRQAQTIRIAVQFKVSSVGTVPLNVTLDPIFGNAIMSLLQGPKFVRLPVIVTVIIYHLAKILRATHRLGPGSMQRLLNEISNFKKWDVDVRVARKGLDLNFTKLAKLYMLDKDKGLEHLKKMAEILAPKKHD